MSTKTVDVVIPAYRPGKEFQTLIKRLMSQSIVPDNVFILQTVVDEEEKMIQSLDSRMHVIPVLQSEFDHGGTRHLGASKSQADFIMFMTQDAMPVDKELIANLVSCFEDSDIGIAYGRQLARPEAGRLERMTREFNYPNVSRTKSLEDAETLGIKTYFNSDVCAMYRREYYEEMGGFVSPAIFNEDMIMAYYMIHAGYKVKYQADAKVIHSHDYTLKQQFKRNFDLGVSQKQYSVIFASISSEKEGAGYAKRILKKLIHEFHVWDAFYFAMQCGFKLFGYKLGVHYNHLPKSVIRKCTGSGWYWK